MTAASWFLIVCGLVGWVSVGLAVARWAWTWFGVYPTTRNGHLALGASAWLWPLLALCVAMAACIERWIGND